MASYTAAAFQAYFSVVFLLKKAKRSYEKFMKGIAVIMPVQSHWLLKLFVMGSTG